MKLYTRDGLTMTAEQWLEYWWAASPWATWMEDHACDED